jgi:hypothetical protein
MESYNGFSEENLKEIARKKISFRFSVRLHISIFLIVNSLLYFINLLSTPSYLWIIYPVFGWLIGVAEHTTAYLVYARGVYPGTKKGLIFHIVSFIFVNMFLLIIYYYNEIYLPIYYAWFLFPLVFWGVGLLIHLAVYLIYFRTKTGKEGILQSKREKAIERELEKMKAKFKK